MTAYTKKTRAEKVAESAELLHHAVMKICNEKEYKQYLTNLMKMSSYSVRNSVLIYCQNPGASLCYGYQQWKKLGRWVKKGERGIKILAPCKGKRTKADGTDEEYVYFRTVTVFDVSQTDGEPLKHSGEIAELNGTTPNFFEVLRCLEQVSPLPIIFNDKNLGTAKGLTTYKTGEIFIKPGMSEVQTVKTVVHEITHALLHNPSDDVSDNEILQSSSAKETEAESVAFVVCNALGIDTSDYSFEYVARWSFGQDIILKSLDRIKKTAESILKAIETELKKED